ncbi:MAG: type II toxin-antitoxin system VapC family toxin [Pseudomonadales bacterium]
MNEKKSVYLETSFISYLTGRPSRDVIAAGHQAVTQEWWEKESEYYHLVVSELVVREAQRGHEEAAARRLSAIDGIELLQISDEAIDFADSLLANNVIPRVATADAIHVSMAAINGIDYLLTWNCKHIANADQRQYIEMLCIENNYKPPVICTPEELMRGD